jgi:hypothetical protein
LDHVGVELPKYPVAASEAMPDESRTRQAAVALLVLEATLLGLSLPVQLLMFVSLGWEGGDEALKQRMIDAVPLLGLGGLLAAVLCGLGASAVWRDTREAITLATAAAGLVVLLGAGWAVVLQGALLGAPLAPVWVVMTAPAPMALALSHVVRRTVRPASGSPPR